MGRARRALADLVEVRRDKPRLAPTGGEALDGGVQEATIEVARLRVTLEQLLVNE